ncbi:permease [Streptococcus pneumoniae]|nr:permease [Streptococcus pneumoniae]
MEWIRLIGIAIIVVGFILKFDTIATVVLAGLVTALVSGVSLVEFLEILGKEFSNESSIMKLATLP